MNEIFLLNYISDNRYSLLHLEHYNTFECFGQILLIMVRPISLY